ncbi:MAG: hypothetical protein SFZ03_05900 [Candidatus Melainabacteria bacterium]|nr:hypothetical protein [Candidatus Melainabacteria bacterium]
MQFTGIQQGLLRSTVQTNSGRPALTPAQAFPTHSLRFQAHNLSSGDELSEVYNGLASLLTKVQSGKLDVSQEISIDEAPFRYYGTSRSPFVRLGLHKPYAVFYDVPNSPHLPADVVEYFTYAKVPPAKPPEAKLPPGKTSTSDEHLPHYLFREYRNKNGVLLGRCLEYRSERADSPQDRVSSKIYLEYNRKQEPCRLLIYDYELNRMAVDRLLEPTLIQPVNVDDRPMKLENPLAATIDSLFDEVYGRLERTRLRRLMGQGDGSAEIQSLDYNG